MATAFKKLSHRHHVRLPHAVLCGPFWISLPHKEVLKGTGWSAQPVSLEAVRNIKKTIHHPICYENEGNSCLRHGFKNYEKALEVSVKSWDTNLINLVIHKMMKSIDVSEDDIFKLFG